MSCTGLWKCFLVMAWNRRRKCTFAGKSRFGCSSGDSEAFVMIRATAFTMATYFLSYQYTRHLPSSYHWIYWLPDAESHLCKCLICLSHVLQSRTCSKFKTRKFLRFPFSCFCQWSTLCGSVHINSYQELIFWISFFITSPWVLVVCCPMTSLFCKIQECISPCLTYSQKWKFLFITWWKLKDRNPQCVLLSY